MSETRLDSFPFDSLYKGKDELERPILDRAVGASMLRHTYRQFFSDGVFGTPATNLRPSKGTGLNVRLEGGMGIINGAMAAVPEDGQEFELTSESPTAGTYAYGIFLRYDENFNSRCCYIVTRKGEAGENPQPPEVVTTLPGIKELRIGYVVIPTGSTDLSQATLYDERGTAKCPFVMPLFDVDVSYLVEQVKSDIDAEYREYSGYVDTYIEMLKSAVDGTTAGDLANRMTAVEVLAADTKRFIEDVNETLNGYSGILLDATGVE